jgi:hypothetical protein
MAIRTGTHRNDRETFPASFRPVVRPFKPRSYLQTTLVKLSKIKATIEILEDYADMEELRKFLKDLQKFKELVMLPPPAT